MNNLLSCLCAGVLALLLQTAGRADTFGVIKGTVYDNERKKISNASVHIENTPFVTNTNQEGTFFLEHVPIGSHTIIVSHIGYKDKFQLVHITLADVEWMHITLDVEAIMLTGVEVRGQHWKSELTHLDAISGVSLYAGKKNEVLELSRIDANLALNTSRQVFAKVAGTNIWENDGSGIQMNIATRGLSPNRSWEYNVRQNGANIQADVTGYPDTYYTPPLEAVERIEVVRGAGALQYGAQLGGMVNFKLKTYSGLKAFSLESVQTKGSYGLFNSYNSVSGQKGKFGYFAFLHHRSAAGWRRNADYRTNTAYAAVTYKPGKKLVLGLEFTRMKYLQHLSAGLTDSLYAADARASYRERNWFEVIWNVPALTLDYAVGEKTKVKAKVFALIADRNSIEYTKPMNVADDGGPRDLRRDAYLNVGSEINLLHTYHLFNQKSALSAGVRLYKGRTMRGQGLGTDAAGPDFNFVNPGRLEYSDYVFHTVNAAFFAENTFALGKRLLITPGIRYEFIRVDGRGYYNAADSLVQEDLNSSRRFPLLGASLSYALSPTLELYSNLTQGYRPILFNDIRVTNPNLFIDKGLHDSRGYSFDAGVRTKNARFVSFDVDWFYLLCNGRIGTITYREEGGKSYQYMTNIANSRSTGMEAVAEVQLLRLIHPEAVPSLSLFTSYSYIDAKYINAGNTDIHRKSVEFAPAHIIRSGATFGWRGFSSTLTYNHVGSQFADASNTEATRTGNEGIVPAYDLVDLSARYTLKSYTLSFGVNNLLNKKYFTRRANAYPGPGLVPGEPAVYYLGLGFKL